MKQLKDKQDRIYLTGFMGTGKSTVGAHLSRITSRRIIDTDSLIEKESGMSIAEIFKSHNEAYFRELERSVLVSTFQLKNVIISTGSKYWYDGWIITYYGYYSSIYFLWWFKYGGIVYGFRNGNEHFSK